MQGLKGFGQSMCLCLFFQCAAVSCLCQDCDTSVLAYEGVLGVWEYLFSPT